MFSDVCSALIRMSTKTPDMALKKVLPGFHLPACVFFFCVFTHRQADGSKYPVRIAKTLVLPGVRNPAVFEN